MDKEQHIEYKINKFLKLKLNGTKTYIYVDGELFKQCKFLLLQIPKGQQEETWEYDNIDELKHRYSNEHERNTNIIDPKTEFWGHCSNLQAWHENNYDTRLLEMRLAFPLLYKLADAGDKEAKQRLAEEVAKRFINGNSAVRTYLIAQCYLSYLTKTELQTMFAELSTKEIRTIISDSYDGAFYYLKKGLSRDELKPIISSLEAKEIINLLPNKHFQALFSFDENFLKRLDRILFRDKTRGERLTHV